MGILTDILGGFSNLFNTGYSIYQDQRNFNYQKEQQTRLDEREDTAMQRRFADYAAAGINPLMALGSSGASASAVPLGSASIEPLKVDINARKIENEKLKQEQDNTKTGKELNSISIDMAKRQNAIDEMNFYNQIGLPYSYGYGLTSNGVDINVRPNWWALSTGNTMDNLDLPYIKSENMPLQKIFNDNLNILNANAGIAGTNYTLALNDLLLSNKDLKWDTFNRALNATQGVTGIYKDILSPFHFNTSSINTQSFGQYQSLNQNHNYNNNYYRR